MDKAKGHLKSHDSSPQEGNADCFFDAREYESSGSEEESPPQKSTVKTRLNYCEKNGSKSDKKQHGAETGYEDELGGKTCRTVIGYNQGKIEECDRSVSTMKPGSDVEALADLLRDGSHINRIFSSMDTGIVSPSLKQRSIQECLAIYKHDSVAKSLSDEEIITLVQHKHIPAYQLEKAVGDMERGVAIRYDF